MTTDNDAGGANPSYQGYDYQKLITVWVALELMFGAGAASDHVIVEPASHDDIKVHLNVPADAAEARLRIAAAGELHVQIKFKGAGAWSPAEFAGVVNDKAAYGARGPRPRPRAKALLVANPGQRYVFITNASVDGHLAKGRIASPGEAGRPGFVPTNLTNLSLTDRQSLAGRFALIEGMSYAETRRRIDSLLTGALHVPAQALDACLDRLKRAVEDRFLAVPDPLTKRDIGKIAEGFGGVPHANPQLARYVVPATLALAETSLQTLGAVLLIGPSGYGKSLTADKLAYDYRNANPPYQVIREDVGLPAIEAAFAVSGRVLFHLEDPWGQSGLKTGEAQEWSKRISDLIRQKAADKLFVITSRSEIFRAALSASPPPVWADRAVIIDDAAYDPDARRQLLHRSLAGTGAWRQDLARQHEARLLRALKSPFELVGFGRELKAVAAPADADVERLIDRALSDSRLQVVRDQINAFGDPGVRGAAVLWALLRSSRNLQPARLTRLRREVSKSSSIAIGLDDLADYLAQTQLTKDGDGAYTAHAKVVEAMEAIAREQFRAAEDALNASARAALTLAAADLGWLDVVERLVMGARALEDAGVELDEAVVAAFDAFLVEGLTKAVGKPGAFRTAWRNADRQLSGSSPIGRLVDWLEHGAPKLKGGFAAFGWSPPKVSKADREAVIAVDPDLDILKGFIAHQLPRTHTDYDADKMLGWLKPFAADFTEAFLAAGNVVAKAPEFVMSADAIADCALTGDDPPFDVVWAQVEAMQAIVDDVIAKSSEERRQAWQGELDFAHGLHLQERVQEEGRSAEHFAKGYVRARRRRQGHAWIAAHPRPDIVLPLWADAMKFNLPKVTAPELDAFFVAAGIDDRLQAAGLSVIADRRLAFGRDRVLAALSTGGPKAIDAAVRALSFLEGDDDGTSGRPSAQAILLALLGTLPWIRAVMLAPKIVDLELGSKKAGLAQRVLAAAPPEAAAAVHLALSRALGADDATLLNQFRALPPGQAETLMAEGPRNLTRLLLLISGAEQRDIQAVAAQWAGSEDEDDAQAAVRALAELGTPAARAAIVKALTHDHFEVRRAALRALAPKANAVEKAAVLKLAKDKSAPVRQALACVIGEARWVEGLDTLESLLGDRRNYCRHPEHQRRDEPEYHVARAAAEALGRFDPLPAPILKQVVAFLLHDSADAVDVVLHATLLDLLTYPDHAAAWTAIEHGLTDGHVVGGADENLYPVRYAAAWAAVHRVSRHPFEHNLVPWAAIKAAVDHIDAQLAAPLLLALGAQLVIDSDATTFEALRGPNASDVRKALALSIIDDRDTAAELARKHGLLVVDHPFLDQADDLAAGDTELSRSPLSTRARDWLFSLRAGADVEATLLWVMAQRTGLDFGVAEFTPWALRRKTSIPITTFAEMFGME